MTKQRFSRFVSLGTLGLLVSIFGVISLGVLLEIAAPLFVPKTGAFVFSVSSRAFTGALLVSLAVIATALFLIVRALRRRHSQ
jgi:hypothetical protein